MSLLHLFHELPLSVLTLLLVLGACAYSVGLMLGTRFLYGVDRLRLNNEVAGFKFAVIGTFYAVLLAFVVVAQWQDYSETETAVRDEAKAIVDLHRVTSVLTAEAGAEIRKNLVAYTEGVREYEWQTMALGEPSDAVAEDLDRLSKAILGAKPGTSQELAAYQEALRLLARITDNRAERLDSSDGSMSAILWIVLIMGSLITLGYPAFFGSTNLVAQVLMTASLAILVALALLLGLVFDYPFTGEVRVSPAPLDQALRQMPSD